MSTDTPATATPVPVVKLTSIQMIEQELQGFFKQAEAAAKNAEQAIANTHAIQGAIQGAQHLLAKLRAAEQAAVKEVETLAGEAEAEVKHGITLVEKL